MLNINTCLCLGQFKGKEIINNVVGGQSFSHKGEKDHMSSKVHCITVSLEILFMINFLFLLHYLFYFWYKLKLCF